MEPTATLPSRIEAEGELTSCHELFVVYQGHYCHSTLMLIIRALVAWALNGDTRDVDILHLSISRAEHTLSLSIS
ncbi:hypothetical protein K439DRAFT_1638251, partial [Ramaria rubella]